MLAAAMPALLALVACRDAPSFADPPALPPLGPEPYRLTFDPRPNERPAWDSTGDSVFYSTGTPITVLNPATSMLDTLSFRYAIDVLPARGGASRRVLPLLQPPGGNIPSVDGVGFRGSKLAIESLLPLAPPVCDVAVPVNDCPAEIPGFRPRLYSSLLRLRSREAETPPDLDPTLTVMFDGLEFGTDTTPDGLIVTFTRMHPFQERFSRTMESPLRPSLSPDGRVVFSDGLRLFLWDGASVSPIPGTEDGMRPAWSPDGEWIAFEQVLRGARRSAECTWQDLEVPGADLCREFVEYWPILSIDVAVVRPDGTDLRVVARGEDPAWFADSRRLAVVRDGSVWIEHLDGAQAAAVPFSERGRDPALSPDGRRLAISRDEEPSGGSDIDILEVEP